MKIPFDGNVNARLVEKRFKGQVFYSVTDPQGGKDHEIEIGFLRLNGCLKYPMIQPIKNGEVKNYSHGCSWSMIFETLDDAKKQQRLINGLYNDEFHKKPFIKRDFLKKIKPELLELQSVISLLFDGHVEFNGVNFSDVGAGGVQVYAAGYHTTIKYDLSNKVSVIGSFIKVLNGK